MRTPLLDQDAIATLVDRFYSRVQIDPVLGPVFNPAVQDWDEHKRRLTSFWASVALRAGSYRGNPMAAHRSHPIDAGHFDHWLALWRKTCSEVLEATAADAMIEYAERIGRGLRMGLGLPPPGCPLDLPIIGVEFLPIRKNAVPG
ncbi:MAG: group III truncated hemoglobin [Rhodanobacter sp.]|nr:MAG: group III truncated hemoglobin [Rhodanobacter sp.]